MTNWNPRFVYFSKAHGKSPEDMNEHLSKAHKFYEFSLWISESLMKFKEESPESFCCGGLIDHDKFDTYLEKVSMRDNE